MSEFAKRHFNRGVTKIVPDLVKRLNAHARELKPSEARKDILMACNWLTSMQEELTADPFGREVRGPGEGS